MKANRSAATRLRARLKTLDAAARRNAVTSGGFVRRRRVDEPVDEHLRYLTAEGGFGVGAVAEDLLEVLGRLRAVEVELRELQGSIASAGDPPASADESMRLQDP